MCFEWYDVIHCHDGIDCDYESHDFNHFLIIDCCICVNKNDHGLHEHVQRHVATIFVNLHVLKDNKYKHVNEDRVIVIHDCLNRVDNDKEWVILWVVIDFFFLYQKHFSNNTFVICEIDVSIFWFVKNFWLSLYLFIISSYQLST